jgi:hypothetical protein
MTEEIIHWALLLDFLIIILQVILYQSTAGGIETRENMIGEA